METDAEVFARLRGKYRRFRHPGNKLAVGEEIAEGAQAEIFSVSGLPRSDGEYVLKVFKEGYRLRDNGIPAYLRIVSRFRPPEGCDTITYGELCFRSRETNLCYIPPGTLLQFSFDPLQVIIDCNIADFESSVGTVGTGYWRAPEILRALQEGVKPEAFTERADMYSFAMTCYEVLTGRTPFENLPGGDYWRVIEGQRPQLPAHVHPLWETFLRDCWHENPSQRPSVEEIRVYLEKIHSQGETLAILLDR